MKKRILVLEDEPAIAMAVKDELEFEGFEVSIGEEGSQGLETILEDSPDLLVLDIMLPGKNGFEICREMRKRGIRTPVVMLTARAQEVDKIRGLDLGADDYIVKPFSLAELVARIRAVLRRYEKADDLETAVLEAGDLRLDFGRREVLRKGEKIELTRKEFELLALLVKRRGEVISRDEFLDSVWGEEVYVTHRTIDTHITALRKKIEEDPAHPAYIQSVRGVGYKFNENPALS